jgi:hypothetical protein
MKRWLFSLIASTCLLAAPAAFANFHLFQIEQIFSNADGTVQFVVLHESTNSNGENLLGGNPLISMHAGTNKLFTFPGNLPSLITAGKRALIATQGFAALGIVTPDYIIPNGFLPTDGGTLNYAGADSVTYSALPTDGVTAITRTGAMIPNVATNFAGATGSVVAVAAPPPAAFVPIDGVWANTAENGRGFALGFKHGVLIVAIYAYLPDGTAQWYLASGPVVNNVFTATLDKYVGGQCISCVYTGPPMVTGNDGAITITFTSNTSATVNLPGGRVTQIAPFQF